MRKIIPFVLLASMQATPAQAFQDEARHRLVVSYADLDLSTPAGMAKLELRAKHAVRRACDHGEPRRASDIAEISACQNGAWKDATRQIEFAATNFPSNPGKSYSR